MSERNKSAWLIVAVPLVLIGSYIGAYYTMIVPAWSGNSWWPSYPAAKRIVGATVPGWGFLPIHTVDRRIRPHVWNP